MRDVKGLRLMVDRVDRALLDLLNERSRLSQQIGVIKNRRSQPIYAPDREKAVLDRLKSLNRGPLPPGVLEAIYREIMSGSLSLEKKLKIAYLGPELTFTHQASIKKFGHSVEYVPCAGISDVFLEVEHDRADYGVVPVENSTEGAIYHTLDRFVDSDLKMYSEVILRIQLNLLSKERGLRSIRRVYSNPQVFGQCRQWLESRLPSADLKSVASTALAAQVAAREKGAACIASRLAVQTNDLRVLAPSIQDRTDNTTRFIVLARQSTPPTRGSKTSVILSVRDRSGALLRVLTPFKNNRINLSKIESRPSRRRNWEYYFFIDFEGHESDTKVRKTLKALERECVFIKVLGSYPKAEA